MASNQSSMAGHTRLTSYVYGAAYIIIEIVSNLCLNLLKVMINSQSKHNEGLKYEAVGFHRNTNLNIISAILKPTPVSPISACAQCTGPTYYKHVMTIGKINNIFY
jgi:hypothetical protein